MANQLQQDRRQRTAHGPTVTLHRQATGVLEVHEHCPAIALSHAHHDRPSRPVVGGQQFEILDLEVRVEHETSSVGGRREPPQPSLGGGRQDDLESRFTHFDQYHGRNVLMVLAGELFDHPAQIAQAEVDPPHRLSVGDGPGTAFRRLHHRPIPRNNRAPRPIVPQLTTHAVKPPQRSGRGHGPDGQDGGPSVVMAPAHLGAWSDRWGHRRGRHRRGWGDRRRGWGDRRRFAKGGGTGSPRNGFRGWSPRNANPSPGCSVGKGVAMAWPSGFASTRPGRRRPGPGRHRRRLARSHDRCPHGVGRHHEDPARINPVVVDERPAVRLRPAIIERLDLAVKAPVA